MRTERALRAAALSCVLAGMVLAGCTGPRPPEIGGETDGTPTRPPDVSHIPDAVPRYEPRSQRGNPPFYEVLGRRYYVMKEAAGYRERGVASWYGTKFHGRMTSSGEPYDMYAMTAAHKTLPLPSYVRVTHRGNGRSIVVRVNDRGPFVGERIIDLSYAAAVRLGMHSDGTALVDVEAILPGTAAEAPAVAPDAVAARPEPVWLQVGAFSDEANATRLGARLADEGIQDVVTLSEQRARQRIYRVKIGPLTAIDEIERMLERVRELGITDAHLATD
ncbi:MAG TPA: septal ring lytic transglycosylase RlpA family protein [Gammaproteobacteria bacterium]|nr:septal ring lytic transglycosylase RlpA family protein [Gammaproteobacteria bacterium]